MWTVQNRGREMNPDLPKQKGLQLGPTSMDSLSIAPSVRGGIPRVEGR
jgi:hypothetical protein